MDKLQRISSSEMEIMQVIWHSEGAVTTAQIQQALSDKAWKPTTVLTFLSRLVEKGLLRAERQGKSNRYFPLVDEAAYKAAETRAFMREVHGNSVASFFAAFAAGDSMSREEIEQLRKWLEEQ